MEKIGNVVVIPLSFTMIKSNDRMVAKENQGPPVHNHEAGGRAVVSQKIDELVKTSFRQTRTDTQQTTI